MGQIILITSGKGGVGKSTVTANLGAALCMRGKKVLVVDADLGLRNLDLLLGVSGDAVFHLVDVIAGNCPFEKAVIPCKTCKNLYLLPASQMDDASSVTPEQMRILLESESHRYDFILVDCPAGLGRGFQNAAAACKSALVVVTPDQSSLRDADRIAGILEQAGITDCKIVINQVRPSLLQKGGEPDTEEILEQMGLDLLGVVPDDDLAILCGNRGELITGHKDATIARAFFNMADRLLGKPVPLLTLLPKKRSLFGRMFGRRKTK